MGILVAGMTAFYMFRLMGLTFWGRSRVDPAVEPKIHESPPSMTVPLILLAFGAIGIGLAVGIPPGTGLIAQWLDPVFEEAIRLGGYATESYQLAGIDGGLALASVAVATTGIVVAWRLFGVRLLIVRAAPRPDLVRSLSARLPFLYRASFNKWWFDDLNHLLFIVIGGRVASACWWFDRVVVDGTVNGIGALTVGTGRTLRRVQTGHVQNYALGIAIGLIVMAGSYLFLVAR